MLAARAQTGEGVKGSKGNLVPSSPSSLSRENGKESCLFFQVDVHVLCTQDDIPPVETCGVR